MVDPIFTATYENHTYKTDSVSKLYFYNELYYMGWSHSNAAEVADLLHTVYIDIFEATLNDVLTEFFEVCDENKGRTELELIFFYKEYLNNLRT